RRALHQLGIDTILIRKRPELDAISGLVLPGGESTTMLKLLDEDFRAALADTVSRVPTLATCAGLILIAKGVSGPEQASLGVLEVDVLRNAYGRQVQSFVSVRLSMTESGERVFGTEPLEGVFIRAPKIAGVG